MKPEIIHLEPHDTVHVVMDRMDQSRLERILLVFPARRAPLTKRLDLGMARRVVQDLELALMRLERNVNARLLAEVLLLDLPEV